MLKRSFMALLFMMLFPFLNSMRRGEDPFFEECVRKSMLGSLQSYLYKVLDKLWMQRDENSIWARVNRYAFAQINPVLLYFVFRTYYDFAYAFDGVKIRDIPQNPNLSLSFNSRLIALKSLMLFHIKSKIDSEICHELGLGDNSKWIHEEFGRKFLSRVAIFDKLNKNNCDGRREEDLTFKYVFENVQPELQDVHLFEQIKPAWISLCSKSKWRYVGAWSETFYFADDASVVDLSLAESIGPSRFLTLVGDSRKSLLLHDIYVRTELLVENHTLSDLEKWREFLAI